MVTYQKGRACVSMASTFGKIRPKTEVIGSKTKMREETRDFTSVFDLVQGLVKCGYYESALGENFNLAAGRETRIVDLIEMVNTATGNTAPILQRPRRKWDTKPRLLASITKAQKLIDYRPIVAFDSGFQRSVEWFRDNWNEIQGLADFPPGMSSAVRKTAK